MEQSGLIEPATLVFGGVGFQEECVNSCRSPCMSFSGCNNQNKAQAMVNIVLVVRQFSFLVGTIFSEQNLFS